MARRPARCRPATRLALRLRYSDAMRRALRLHPNTPTAVVSRLAVEVVRVPPSGLALRYVASGAVNQVRLPPPATVQRTDGLWRSTCFEAFVRAPDSDAYYEFNFSPSTQWAAYCFTSPRRGMVPALDISEPSIAARASNTRYDFHAEIRNLPRSLARATWRVGVCAVIEDVSGRISYWALRHPPGKPDFHHFDCFDLELPAA
jgi:hypothetical protein